MPGMRQSGKETDVDVLVSVERRRLVCRRLCVNCSGVGLAEKRVEQTGSTSLPDRQTRRQQQLRGLCGRAHRKVTGFLSTYPASDLLHKPGPPRADRVILSGPSHRRRKRNGNPARPPSHSSGAASFCRTGQTRETSATTAADGSW